VLKKGLFLMATALTLF